MKDLGGVPKLPNAENPSGRPAGSASGLSRPVLRPILRGSPIGTFCALQMEGAEVALNRMRSDGRRADELRAISIRRQFTDAPAGSVLWSQGKTVVLCTVSIAADLPPWFDERRAGGWVTAEYVMLPGSTPQRKPWPKIGHTDSRGTEIQRLIGRSLRAAIDLTKIGPHTLAVDCQVTPGRWRNPHGLHLGGVRGPARCGGEIAPVHADAKDARQEHNRSQRRHIDAI